MINTVKILQNRLKSVNFCKLRPLSTSTSHPTLSFSQKYLKNEQQIINPLLNPYLIVNKTYYSTNGNSQTNNDEFSEIKFENYCSETLEAMSDYFDELVEKYNVLTEADVTNKVRVQFISTIKNKHLTSS